MAPLHLLVQLRQRGIINQPMAGRDVHSIRRQPDTVPQRSGGAPVPQLRQREHDCGRCLPGRLVYLL